jgi:glycerol-3-phosphate O-acyltransferase/dihydroxyacetone phosphate acyltransferase
LTLAVAIRACCKFAGMPGCAAVLATLCRNLAQAIVRLFYPERVIEDAGALPVRGPVIYVSNHVNGLMDPLLIRVVVQRRARFLAKSTLFGNPFGRLAMKAFGCVSIHRDQDGRGGGVKARAAANEAAFARCREALFRGDALALFPEGISHSEPRLKPLKKGAARVAISAEREHQQRTGQPLGLVVVPLGLSYQDKTAFRSQVVVSVGPSIRVAELLAQPAPDGRSAEDLLTERMRAGLDQVVLQAESREILAGMSQVADWTSLSGRGPARSGEQHRRARQLLEAHRTLAATAPQIVQPMIKAARDYARVLRRLGVRDPAALEAPPLPRLRTLAVLAALLLGAPVALIGALLGVLPYALAGYLARRITDEEDMVSTLKMLAGALFLFVFWLAEAVAVAWVAGPRWGPLAFAGAVGTGYVAIRFKEGLVVMKAAVQSSWRRARRSRQTRRLAERRQALADEAARVLRSAAGPARTEQLF